MVALDTAKFTTSITNKTKLCAKGNVGISEQGDNQLTWQFLEDSRHEGRECSDERELVCGWTTGISLSASSERNLSL